MDPVVEFRSVSKSFHGVMANENINLCVQKGSIHAIVGENGAGKSTAMKVLYGTHQPDSGEIYICGKLWGRKGQPWASPFDAIQNGIGMVHQHFMLADPVSVLDNILLGQERVSQSFSLLPSFLRQIDRKSIRNQLDQIASQYGMHVDWDAKIEDLSVGVQQRIEILKLLYRQTQILILDEPTAVLTPQEATDLFKQLRGLAEQGKTVLMITHKLKEVMDVADRVSVFRGGHVVGEREIQNTSVEDLATLMVGRKMNLTVQIPAQQRSKEPILELSKVSLNAHRSLHDLDFEVYGGEIVGISGVEGNGQAELLQLLLHPSDFHRDFQGSIHIRHGNSRTDIRHLSAAEIRMLGVGVIPDDRHRDGLLLKKSVRENFLLGLQRRKPFYDRGLISEGKLDQAVRTAIEEFDIRPKSLEIESENLSGGNQQKLIIAREFKFSPKLLIAAQPTRGVDIGAIETIHNRMIRARSEGSAILLISSELDEILELSDRILMFYGGRIVEEFKRNEVNEQVLGLRMGGLYAK